MFKSYGARYIRVHINRNLLLVGHLCAGVLCVLVSSWISRDVLGISTRSLGDVSGCSRSRLKGSNIRFADHYPPRHPSHFPLDTILPRGSLSAWFPFSLPLSLCLIFHIFFFHLFLLDFFKFFSQLAFFRRMSSFFRRKSRSVSGVQKYHFSFESQSTCSTLLGMADDRDVECLNTIFKRLKIKQNNSIKMRCNISFH